MKLLLDTPLLLWALVRPDLLPGKAASVINDPANILYFSVVSIWEITIKYALKRREFNQDPDVLRGALLANDYIELPITGPQAIAIAALPAIHRDPFDRLLVAQAKVEGLTILTADPVLGRYPGRILRV